MHKVVVLVAVIAIITLTGFFNHYASTLNSTTTAIIPSSATVNAGSKTQFTATVTDTSASPTQISGTVTWHDHNAQGTFNPTSCTLPSGGCTTTYTPAANSSSIVITARYSGDNTHSESAGNSSLTITHFHSTTTAVIPSSAAASSISKTQFTATVTDTSASPTQISGTVTWHDHNAQGTFNPTSCTLPSGGCTTTYTPSENSPSLVIITARYSGDTTHSESAGNSSLTVTALHHTIATITPNPVNLPHNGTIKFIVRINDSSSSPTTPTGIVSWKDGNAGGRFNVTSCSLSSTGTCSSTYTASGSPPHVITINATYLGDSTHMATYAAAKISTNVLFETITKITPNPATFTPGNPVTLTATVKDTSNPAVPLIGSVAWSDQGAGGTFTPNVCDLSSNHCSLTYSPPSNPSGSITIAASYIGDTYHLGSSSISSVVIAAPSQPATTNQSSQTGQNSSQHSNVPEFPVSLVVLSIAIILSIAFYRIKFR